MFPGTFVSGSFLIIKEAGSTVINIYGIVFITAILIPNIIYAIKCNEGFDNSRINKTVEIIEQIGRYGCMAAMIVIFPILDVAVPSGTALWVYIAVDTVLLIVYILCWIIFWKKNGLARALTLSVTPSVLFLFSGIMTRYILLIAAALLFAPAHIYISCKNAK